MAQQGEVVIVFIPGGARFADVTGSEAVPTWTLVAGAGFVPTGTDTRFRDRDRRREARKAGA